MTLAKRSQLQATIVNNIPVLPPLRNISLLLVSQQITDSFVQILASSKT
jgi:hypothetical protein